MGRGGAEMFKRMLLCYDGSDMSRSALKRSAELAILVNAEVFVLSVVSEAAAKAAVAAGSVGTACLVNSERDQLISLKESVAWLKERGLEACGSLVRGDTIDAIVMHAKRTRSDLIIVGHYPKSTEGRWWSGSQRASLDQRVNCCVLIAAGE